MLALREKSDGQEFVARLGDIVSLTLYENPSAGYSWELSLPDSVEIVSDDFVGFSLSNNGEGSELAGGGAERVWLLKVGEAGSVSLGAKYARSWEPEPIQVWSARVEVVS